jgi:hypothetical protein
VCVPMGIQVAVNMYVYTHIHMHVLHERGVCMVGGGGVSSE